MIGKGEQHYVASAFISIDNNRQAYLQQQQQNMTISRQALLQIAGLARDSMDLGISLLHNTAVKPLCVLHWGRYMRQSVRYLIDVRNQLAQENSPQATSI